MKRSLAVKNLYRVLQRIKNINGIFATALHDHEFVKIKRVWLFGSLAKGSDDPNDIDIFIELLDYIPDSSIRHNVVESHIRKSQRKVRRTLINSKQLKLHGGFKINKKSISYKQLRICSPKNSVDSLAHYLSLSIPTASIHFVHDDLIFDKLDVKCMLFPRCDFDFDIEKALTNSYKKKYKTLPNLP